MLDTTKTINVKIISREGVLFQGEVATLSSVNEKGVFDILPFHTNFISIIYDHISYQDKITGVSHKIPIGRAILKSSHEQVFIYVGN